MHARQGRPDGLQHLVHALGAGARLDPEPEHGEHDAGDDGEVAEPEPERGVVQDREADVQPRADRPVEHHDDRDDDVPYSDGGEGLAPERRRSQSGFASRVSERSPEAVEKQVYYDVQEYTTYHDSPIASMLDASSHTATLVASDTQYAT